MTLFCSPPPPPNCLMIKVSQLPPHINTYQYRFSSTIVVDKVSKVSLELIRASVDIKCSHFSTRFLYVPKEIMGSDPSINGNQKSSEVYIKYAFIGLTVTSRFFYFSNEARNYHSLVLNHNEFPTFLLIQKSPGIHFVFSLGK